MTQGQVHDAGYLQAGNRLGVAWPLDRVLE